MVNLQSLVSRRSRPVQNAKHTGRTVICDVLRSAIRLDAKPQPLHEIDGVVVARVNGIDDACHAKLAKSFVDNRSSGLRRVALSPVEASQGIGQLCLDLVWI